MRNLAVGVCTAQRPMMLKRCLDSLSRQIVPENIHPTIVVADNEAAPNNRAAVETVADSCPFPVLYVHEPRRGISMARNAVLETALDLSAEWIAFIDDDEAAARDWLTELLAAAGHYQTEVIQGHVEPVYPEPIPFWAMPPKKRREGQQKGWASTNNVLFSARLIRPNGLNLRFNEAFALTGGEDTDFFVRAKDSGVCIVHSNKPRVFEYWTRERCSYFWQASRSFNTNLCNTRIQRLRGSAMQELIKAGKTILGGFMAFVQALFVAPLSPSRFKKQALRGGKRLAAAAGRIVGLAGYQIEPYRRIRGD